MASTRSRNTPGNYKQEQSWNRSYLQYNTYHGYLLAKHTYLPGLGLGGAQLPMQMNCQLYDIESELFGIGATNLVNPKTESVLPTEPMDMKTLNIIEAAETVLPEPLKIPANARFDMRD